METEVHSALGPLAQDESFQRFPVVTKLFSLIEQRGLKLALHTCEKGVEFRFLNEVNGMPNRGFLRIFFPTDTKCVLFFHKKSSIPFSRDRFSYGGVVIDARSGMRFSDEDIEEWIRFLLSGLQPKSRPKTLKKSFPYTIPED